MVASCLATPVLAADRYTISCIGDSITYNEYPLRLAWWLNEFVDVDMDWDIRDHGIGGATTGDILSAMRSQGWLNENPDCILIMAGANDIIHASWAGDNMESMTRSSVANVQRMVYDIRNRFGEDRPRIIVSYATPFMSKDMSYRANYYNEQLKASIWGADLITMANWEDIYLDWGKTADQYLMRDYVHPNYEGQDLITENFMQAIEALFYPEKVDEDPYLHRIETYLPEQLPGTTTTPTTTTTADVYTPLSDPDLNQETSYRLPTQLTWWFDSGALGV